jgi:hypothetical protein
MRRDDFVKACPHVRTGSIRLDHLRIDPKTSLTVWSCNPKTSLTVALMPWKETDSVKERVKFVLGGEGVGTKARAFFGARTLRSP